MPDGYTDYLRTEGRRMVDSNSTCDWTNSNHTIVFNETIEPKSVDDILNIDFNKLNGCTITRELMLDICKRIKSLEQSEKHKGDFV